MIVTDYGSGSVRLPSDAVVRGCAYTTDASLRSASVVMGVRLPADAVVVVGRMVE